MPSSRVCCAVRQKRSASATAGPTAVKRAPAEAGYVPDRDRAVLQEPEGRDSEMDSPDAVMQCRARLPRVWGGPAARLTDGPKRRRGSRAALASGGAIGAAPTSSSHAPDGASVSGTHRLKRRTAVGEARTGQSQMLSAGRAARTQQFGRRWKGRCLGFWLYC